MKSLRTIFFTLLVLPASAPVNAGTLRPISAAGVDSVMNGIAESYVRLVLAVGEHDSMYVDAYYGPPEWMTEARNRKLPLDSIRRDAARLENRLDAAAPGGAGELEQLRYQYLRKQLASVRARVDALTGRKFSFDEEAKAYYDAVPPVFPDKHFEALIAALDSIVPGKGPLTDRIDAYRKQFIIPPDKLDTVFRTAIRECRARTLKHITLPENESFRLEYVHDKPWGGYNWYQGNNRSLIQINVDLPTHAWGVVGLCAHEGYPGHHVYNCLLETNLVRKRGWVDFTVYPLFSPQSLIAEGTANFGIEVAFPGNERLQFERDVIFPLAGLDPAKAEQYSKVQSLIAALGYAENEAARRYLDGRISRDSAAAWLERYALQSPRSARHSLSFIEQYRSYVINYNLGQDLVRAYIERRGGTPGNPEKRWEEFAKLISSPRLPSGLE